MHPPSERVPMETAVRMPFTPPRTAEHANVALVVRTGGCARHDHEAVCPPSTCAKDFDPLVLALGPRAEPAVWSD